MKFNAQFYNFINNYEREDNIKYKGFKVIPDYRLKTFRGVKNQRIMLYNPQFFKRLTSNQIFFTLEWNIRTYKYGDTKKAYMKTKEYCMILGIDTAEVEEMLSTIIAFQDFERSHTPSYMKPIKYIQLKIKKWIHKIKAKPNGIMVLK